MTLQRLFDCYLPKEGALKLLPLQAESLLADVLFDWTASRKPYWLWLPESERPFLPAEEQSAGCALAHFLVQVLKHSFVGHCLEDALLDSHLFTAQV